MVFQIIPINQGIPNQYGIMQAEIPMQRIKCKIDQPEEPLPPAVISFISGGVFPYFRIAIFVIETSCPTLYITHSLFRVQRRLL
jgi:hypothetical protein